MQTEWVEMAITRKDGRTFLQVYLRDKRVARLIERAAELDNRNVSSFMAHVSEEAAKKIIARHVAEQERTA